MLRPSHNHLHPRRRSTELRRRAPFSFAALVVVVAAWGVGCKFEPKFTAGTIACQSDQGCPPGFACLQGFCSPPGTPALNGGGGNSSAGGSDGGGVAGAGAGDAATDQTLAPDRPADRAEDGGRDLRSDGADGMVQPGDGGCPAVCSIGDQRCGATGLQLCVMVGGCPAWGQETVCPGRQTCQGSAPTARCTCPAAPTGCSSKGNVCTGPAPGTSRACDVDGEGCVFESSATDCTTGKPCVGSFPNGVCTCPAAPAICGGHPGTYCQSNLSVQTCGYTAGDGCLAVTRTTPCTAAKPCSGTPGMATCSCTSAPAECGGSTGGACRANGDLATCDIDSSGCLAVVGFGACDPGLTCQGTAPNASCQCPGVPDVCRGTTGTFCQGNQLVTCVRDSHACIVVRSSEACAGALVCSGNPGTTRCACPTLPAQCPGGAGRLCDSSGNLVSCVADGNGCVTVASSGPCTSPLVCGGAFPGASCGCPAAPAACMGVTGNTCQSAISYVTCARVGTCLVATGTGTCPGVSKPCTGNPGSAVCACNNTPPPECFSGAVFMVGNACAGGRVTHCVLDGNSCQSGTSTGCNAPQICQGTLPSAACGCPAVPDCDGAGEINGSRCSGATLITCSGDSGCQSETTATCSLPQACVGAYPRARCADEVSYGVPKPPGTESEAWSEHFVAIPINISEPVTLRRFGLIWAGDGANPPRAVPTRVMFGLYPDGIGASGTSAPVGRLIAGALVAVDQPANVEVTPSLPAPGERSVPAGNYWVLLNIEAPISIPRILPGSVARLASPTTAVLGIDSPFANPLLDPIPATVKFVDGKLAGPLNVYLVGVPQQ